MWDLVLAWDSLVVIPAIAAAILSFRESRLLACSSPDEVPSSPSLSLPPSLPLPPSPAAGVIFFGCRCRWAEGPAGRVACRFDQYFDTQLGRV